MPPARLEHTIPASERTQTHALDRAATGISLLGYRPTVRELTDMFKGSRLREMKTYFTNILYIGPFVVHTSDYI